MTAWESKLVPTQNIHNAVIYTQYTNNGGKEFFLATEFVLHVQSLIYVNYIADSNPLSALVSDNGHVTKSTYKHYQKGFAAFSIFWADGFRNKPGLGRHVGAGSYGTSAQETPVHLPGKLPHSYLLP